VLSLVRRWVVGCARARALPRLQLLTALSGVRFVFMGDVCGTFFAQRRLVTFACSLVNVSAAVAMLAGASISVWRCPLLWRPRADATSVVDPRIRRPWPLGC